MSLFHVFITGLNAVEDEQRGLELGAIDFISKPIQAAWSWSLPKKSRGLISLAGEMRSMDQFESQAMTLLTNPATRNAFDLSKEDDFRVGVDMGTGIGGFIEMTGGAISYATKGRLNPLYAPMIIPNMAAASVAMAFLVPNPVRRARP